MSGLALRSHSREILLAVVRDMETSQTETQRSDKAQRAELSPESSNTIAAAHGALRHLSGFDLAQVVSEFRAMRASVLGLWRRSEATRTMDPAIEEIGRFNEAIDQALGEAVERYSSDVTTFLAVVGHDLRSPLAAIQGSGLLLKLASASETTKAEAIVRIERACKVMGILISDLLEYARSRLGQGISIKRLALDLGRACEEALDNIRTIHPKHKFTHRFFGDLHIQADPTRIQQVLTNLLTNAVQHGDKNVPIVLEAEGTPNDVVVTVQNQGGTIPLDALATIFEPLVQVPNGRANQHEQPYTSLGLGLFITRELVHGHQGTIDVRSSVETGTTFTVHLPRIKLLD